MTRGLTKINDNFASFRRKYYLNLAIRGGLLSLSLLLFYFLIAGIVEYNLWLNGTARLLIFSSFILLVAYCFYKFLKEPFSFWLYRRGLGQEESAKIIGDRFPDVRDRLLNLVQLQLHRKNSALLDAGIAQKAGLFENIAFENAVDLGENRRYLKYFLLPFFLTILILIYNRAILTQSSGRIVRFTQEFSPTAPFRFNIQNTSLIAFVNEDFVLHVKVEGDAVPDALYLSENGQRLKLETIQPGEFQYTFEKLQQDIKFQLDGSGFLSDPKEIRVVNRPELNNLKMQLEFPRYVGRRNEELTNSGNAEVPEGTKITWVVTTSHASKVVAGFSSENIVLPMQNLDTDIFKLEKAIENPEQYWIELENENSKNKDRISYSIDVIKDLYPEIHVENMNDSVLYKNVFLGGEIGDDYGLTELTLHYDILHEGKPVSGKINIPVSRGLLRQSFLFPWHVDSLRLLPGDHVNYFLQVWDNDGVNGRKSTKSPVFVFSLPGEDELKSEIVKSQTSTKSQMDKSLKKAQDIRETIDEAQQKLKGKQVLDWQDKKMIEDLVQQKKGLDQMISELQKQNEQLEQKKNSFSEQDEKIKEKAEQIQKLMNELLDPETKKLFEELEKLLKENPDVNQMQKMLDRMNRKEMNLEKELERALELFKQMQFDYKLDQSIKDLEKLEKEQSALLEKTEKLSDEKGTDNSDNKDNTPDEDQKAQLKNDSTSGAKKNEKSSENSDQKSDSQSLKDKQQELQDDFTKAAQNLNELKKMADELNKDAETPSTEDQKQVNDAQQESKESLGKNNPKKAAAPQKKAAQKMKQMKEQLQSAQESMNEEVDMANLETLRQVLHGLIKLSYDQENLMKEFNQIQQTDPKYVTLSQNQLKIKDDSRVLEDSLLALAKKDAFMGSVVTKEVGELNNHLDKSAENVKERRKPNAASEMQLSMTSINNLALMLNDHMEAMMDAMKNAKPGSKKGKGKQPSQSLSQLQRQLNEKIEQLKNGGQSGRQYSEELARVAAEQERIRHALQEMQDKLKKEGGKAPGNDLPGKMEQTEMDLVNKQITEQTIKRQKEIETRLLETEKAMREQEMDEERKGEAARDYDKEIPPAFEEYLRLKEKEVELLKSVPPKFYPYYRKEVNGYFKRIRNQN